MLVSIQKTVSWDFELFQMQHSTPAKLFLPIFTKGAAEVYPSVLPI